MTSCEAIQKLKEAISMLEYENKSPSVVWRPIEPEKCDFIWTDGRKVYIQHNHSTKFTKYVDERDCNIDLSGIEFADKVTFNCRYSVPDGRVFGYIANWFLNNGYRIRPNPDFGNSWLIQFIKEKSCC